jgi:hypothetical protein
MSHTVKKKATVHNLATLQKAVSETPGAKFLGHGTHRLWEGTQTGIGVQLKGWKYPVVFDLNTSEQFFDTYNGRWGKETEFNKLIQEHSAATAEAHYLSKGVKQEQITKQWLPNGKLHVHVEMGDGLSVAGDDATSGPGGYGVAPAAE